MPKDPTMLWLAGGGILLVLFLFGFLISRARSRHNEERYREAGTVNPISYPAAPRRFEPAPGYSPQAYAAQPYPQQPPASQGSGTGRALAAGAVGGVLGGMAGAEISRRLHSGGESTARNWDPPEGPAYYPTAAPETKQSFGESGSHSGSWGGSGGSSSDD